MPLHQRRHKCRRRRTGRFQHGLRAGRKGEASASCPNPYAWNIGATERCRSPGCTASTSRAYPSHVVRMSAWRCIASFGRPVVPEVHSQNDGDSADVPSQAPSPPLSENVRPTWSGCVAVGVGSNSNQVGEVRCLIAQRDDQGFRIAGDDGTARASVTRDGDQIARWQERIDGSATAPMRIGARIADGELRPVPQDHQDPLFGPDAEPAETARCRSDRVEQLRIADRRVALSSACERRLRPRRGDQPATRRR